MRHCICNHQFLQILGAVQSLDGIATHNAMSDNSHGFFSTVLNEDICGFDQGATSICHVVYDNGNLALDVSDKHHPRHLARLRPLLVDKGKPQIQPVGNRRRPLGAARIGADNDTLRQVDILPDPAQGAGLGVQVVDGDVEEALDLAGVQVHCDDVVAAGRLQHVGGELGRDGRARLVLLVLARVGEVGDDGGDAACRCRFAGVDHDHELHQAVVDVAWSRGLEDED